MQAILDSCVPAALPDALAVLARNGGAIPIAGGTNLVISLREGHHRSGTLVDVGKLPELHGIKAQDGAVTVGAATTIAEILDSPVVASHGSALNQAATNFANPLIRNRATVGGNLVDASPAADTAPPLLALNAEVRLASSTGVRMIPLEKFFLGVNKTERRSDELLVSVRWNIPTANSVSGFTKLGLRKGTACSVISAAALLETDDDGLCRCARIALGAVAPCPILVKGAAEVLVGKRLTDDVIETVAQLAVETAQPIDDVRSTAAYRKRVTGVLVRRLLHRLAGELAEGAV